MGYQSPLYAAALGEYGRALHLPHSDGWLLERPIAQSNDIDLTGCYPLFSCANWSNLGPDLSELGERAVAVSMVVDPFCGLSETALATWFPDVCRPFKEHYVVDFAGNWREAIGRHHRRNVRAAAREVEVERCTDPSICLETWTELYDNLIRRHNIHGIAKFSAGSFAQQFRIPGMTVFRATRSGRTVGMLLWFQTGDVAYYHLGAYSEAGYQVGAAFALFDAALGHLAADGIRWAALGGGAGWKTAVEDGLARFKQGWANARRTAWFCGKISNPGAYRQLVAARGSQQTEFFPAYRSPEPVWQSEPVG
jgi:Acetyltransferase (GNAT) domain